MALYIQQQQYKYFADVIVFRSLDSKINLTGTFYSQNPNIYTQNLLISPLNTVL